MRERAPIGGYGGMASEGCATVRYGLRRVCACRCRHGIREAGGRTYRDDPRRVCRRLLESAFEDTDLGGSLPFGASAASTTPANHSRSAPDKPAKRVEILEAFLARLGEKEGLNRAISSLAHKIVSWTYSVVAGDHRRRFFCGGRRPSFCSAHLLRRCDQGVRTTRPRMRPARKSFSDC
jgi:hypothetical protein